MVMCIFALCFGVYSAAKLSYSLSGKITFKGYDVCVNQVTLNNVVTEGENGQIFSQTLSNYENLLIGNGESGVSINVGTPTVSLNKALEISFELTSLKKDVYQKVNIEYSIPSGEKYSVRSTSTILLPNPKGEFQNETTTNFKIYISNKNQSTLNISDLNLCVTFSDYGTSLFKHDEHNDFYYVEMGTIPNSTNTGSEYIKWKLVSLDGQDISNASRYNYSEVVPTSGTGIFVLYTNTLIDREDVDRDGLVQKLNNCTFNNNYDGYNYLGDASQIYHSETKWSNIMANDYATSTIRRYLNGTNVFTGANQYYENIGEFNDHRWSVENTNSHYSNMLTDFCIDKNDMILNKISARTLADLYTGMGAKWNNNNPTKYDYYDVQFPSTLTTLNEDGYTMQSADKFWLLSNKEALNILGGGNWSGGDLAWANTSYWLRTPNDGNSCSAQFVNSTGSYDSYNYFYDHKELASRPAFLLDIALI